MKKKIILPIITGFAIIALSASTVVNSGGVANWSGSPVDGGLTSGSCAACHSGGSSTPTLSVTSSPAFGGSGNSKTYMAGTTYTITITPSGSYSRYGMNCEIINSQAAAVATYPFGTFGAAVSSNCQVYLVAQTGGYPACAAHNSSSTTSAFKFKWTAPASGTGYLYADVLGCTLGGSQNPSKVSGVTSFTLTPASTAGIASHNENEVGLNVFPNPATDNVRLTYTLTERSNVVVKLVNVNGEVVADLVNETQDYGLQSVDTRLPMGLAKGMYLVKLSVNGKQTMQKLIVL